MTPSSHPPRSLRARILFGAVLWTGGLAALTNIVTTALHYRWGLMTLLHSSGMLVVTMICMLAGVAQVRRALASLDDVRTELARLRDGRQSRVGGAFPAEVQPLVDDLNRLLEHREQAIERAVRTAGDLAHGLKTPLSLLAHDADREDAAGRHEIAAAIREQVERMRRQVDYQLARARAAAAGQGSGIHCSVSASAEGLARAMRRLHASRELDIQVLVTAEATAACGREDLDEMLGNLLDNACKWARTRVSVTASAAGSGVSVAVEDDGPGIEPALRDQVLRRGVRADEAAPGSGLGLAIVSELAELYGGRVSLGESALGGLRATLQLPN